MLVVHASDVVAVVCRLAVGRTLRRLHRYSYCRLQVRLRCDLGDLWIAPCAPCDMEHAMWFRTALKTQEALRVLSTNLLYVTQS